MQLHAYLKLKSMSEREFATAVGHSEHGVRKWVRRERIPRPAAMRKIAELTDGAVTPGDWFMNGQDREKSAA